jgi:hypothetical protein
MARATPWVGLFFSKHKKKTSMRNLGFKKNQRIGSLSRLDLTTSANLIIDFLKKGNDNK